MGKGDSIVVAVRVRPFNDREQKRNCKLVIEMPDEQTTVIRDPKTQDEKRFTYDHSYWSHDGFEEQKNGYFSPTNAHYADQKRVFEDLGRGVLANAWAGYNCSLFAYGQTGSGKSYSIVGFKNNKGIVPIVCEELFRQIGEKQKKNATFEVFVSMLEIYCEKVRDLLTTVAPPKGGLKVREHPKNGFYVENLTTVPVNSFKEIEAKIDEGTKNRTIAATQMNATSSRAHTIVKITFNQKSGKQSGSMKKSEINLVDLAGSERQSAAGTEGDRLKEGIVINQSLTTLGRVIKALHDQQKSKSGKKTQIPYRDSVLTCLLKNALGGNSKTIMIAAISPADINFEETLSTLRFADRAKSIKTNAIVNENQTEKALRELREENARLQTQIGGVAGGGDQDEIDKLRQQLAQNQREMEEMEKTWQQKIAEEAAKHAGGASERAEIEAKKRKMCHLWNLNEDPALTNVIVHFVPVGETVVGNKPTSAGNFIQMSGLSILPQHVLLKNDNNNRVTLTPLNEEIEILINGKSIHGETELQQNDRVFFGGNHLYVFANPTKKAARTDITYDSAQAEIAQTHAMTLGGGAGSAATTKRDLILEEELMSTLPLVQRANAMAAELGRSVKFEIVLVSPEMRGLSTGLTEIWVKVHNVSEDTYFIWEKSRFMNRYYGMQEMYEAKQDGADDWNMPKERDPFYEPPDSPVFIASCIVFLQSLAYLIDVEEQFPIVDLSGQEIGLLTVGLSPCSTNGKELRGEYVENPHQLIGKNIAVKVKILSAIGLPRRIIKSNCRYRFFGAKRTTQTATVSGSTPAYGHEETFQFKPVTQEVADYLANSNLYITFWGTQRPRSLSRRSSVSTIRSANVREAPNKTKRIEKMVQSAKSAENRTISVKAIETVLRGTDEVETKKPRKPPKNGNGSANKNRSASRKRDKK